MPNFDDIDLTDVIMDGDPYGNFEDPGGGGDEGHSYDFQMSEDNSSVELTEDGILKNSLPINSNFVGTRAAWDALSVAEKSKYLTMDFKDDEDDEVTHPFSFVGMVVESTTLATLEDVQAIYGSNTDWIQHTGYILRGASSGVTENSAVKDGGEDTHTLTINEMPSHSHGAYMEFGATANSSYGTYDGQSGTYNQWGKYLKSNKVTYTGGGQAHNIMQSYKNVYIWERVS